MDLSAAAKQYCETRIGVVPFGLSQSDPEFSVLFVNFAFDEVMQESRLDDKNRFLSILASLMDSGRWRYSLRKSIYFTFSNPFELFAGKKSHCVYTELNGCQYVMSHRRILR